MGGGVRCEVVVVVRVVWDGGWGGTGGGLCGWLKLSSQIKLCHATTPWLLPAGVPLATCTGRSLGAGEPFASRPAWAGASSRASLGTTRGRYGE